MIIGGLDFIIKSSIQACLLWIVALIAVSLTATKLIDLLKMLLIWDLGYPIYEKSCCIDP